MPKAMHHIALNCRDNAAMEAFYKKWFGFERALTFTDPNENPVVFIRLRDFYLELFKSTDAGKGSAGEGPEVLGGEQPVGFKHFCLDGDNVELERVLASYLVVLISGAYEDCVEHLMISKVSKTRDKEIRDYVQTTIHILFKNPNFDNILQAVKLFSDTHATELRKRVNTKAKEAINSIGTNKNSIAHGGGMMATLGDVEDYHRRCIPIFEALEDILSAR